jgi:hypothetical protein
MSYEDDFTSYSEGKRDWIMVEYPGNSSKIVVGHLYVFHKYKVDFPAENIRNK